MKQSITSAANAPFRTIITKDGKHRQIQCVYMEKYVYVFYIWPGMCYTHTYIYIGLYRYTYGHKNLGAPSLFLC